MTMHFAPKAAALLLACCAAPAFSATVFDNSDVTDELISNASNWDNGLPTGQQGTINIDAEYDSNVAHDGYNILHTDGDISRGNGFASFNLGEGTTWEMNGADAAITQARGIAVKANSSFTLNNGTANLSDNNKDTQVFGENAEIEINGGTMTIGRDLIVRDGGSLIVNGGTLTGIDQLFTQSFAGAGEGYFFNGGSTTAENFQLDTAGTATFGGTTAGDLNLLDGLGNGVTLNWLAGSLMELTVDGADQTFYEGLFTSGDLLFAGSNAGAFGDNFQVSGQTLSLVPEPSSLALLGLGGLCVLRRRRS